MKERTRWTTMRISEAAKAGVKSRADLAGLSVTGYMEREYRSPVVSAPEGAAPALAPSAPAATPTALAAFNDGFDATPPAGLEGHVLTAPAAKECGCGGRGGVAAPYRTLSRLHQLACPFYSRGEC